MKELSRKDLIKLILVVSIIGICVLFYDFVNTNINGRIKRNPSGEGIASELFQVEFLGNRQEIEVEISDKKLSKKAIDKNFQKAIEEIEATYLGNNKSAEHVKNDLAFQKEYVDGLIQATWKTSPYGYISNDGKLKSENIPSEGVLVNVICILSYEENERIYSFNVVVEQKGIDSLEGQLEAINRALEYQDENTRNDAYFKLPSNAEGMKLIWKRKMNYRGIQIILLGFLAVAGLILGKKQDEKKAIALYKDEMLRDYPGIINQLSILMGAGMSFRKALERITGKYVLDRKNGKEVRPGYEAILKAYRKMTDGTGEIQAIEELGKSCDSKEYRKLSMILVQNLRKGSRDLLDSLEKEERYAFEMKKQRALRAGEEASTKLLVPMAGMLFIVIVILVVPAIMQIS